jgi:hypothetical protein
MHDVRQRFGVTSPYVPGAQLLIASALGDQPTRAPGMAARTIPMRLALATNRRRLSFLGGSSVMPGRSLLSGILWVSCSLEAGLGVRSPDARLPMPRHLRQSD